MSAEAERQAGPGPQPQPAAAHGQDFQVQREGWWGGAGSATEATSTAD